MTVGKPCPDLTAIATRIGAAVSSAGWVMVDFAWAADIGPAGYLSATGRSKIA